MKLLYLTLRNLGRNRRRSILTALSIAASLMVFSVLMSLPRVFNAILADRAGSLRVVCHNKAGPLYSMPEAYRNRIRKMPHVVAVTGFTIFEGVYHLPTDRFLNAAMDSDDIDSTFPDWGISGATAAAFKRTRIACLAGKALIDRFGWHVGDRIALRGTLYPVNIELELVGVLGGKAPPIILMFRRDYLEEILGKPGRVNLLWVKLDSSDSIAPVIESIDAEFANSTDQTQTESEEGYFSTMTRSYRVLIGFTQVLAILVMIVITLVAGNTAAMSVRERRAEIAIMRTLGFSGAEIVRSIAAEGLIIGLFGALIGCAAGFGLLRSIGLGVGALGPLAFALRVPASVIVEGIAVGSLIGITAAALPALAAARGNVVNALRTVA